MTAPALLRLVVTTPTRVVVDHDRIVHVRAEDDSGAFGLRPRHADFLTVLKVSVLSWRDAAGAEGHVAVRAGVLEVLGGRLVQVASRDAVAGTDLERLRHNVLDAFLREEEDERTRHSGLQRLQLSALRHIRRYLDPNGGVRVTGGDES